MSREMTTEKMQAIVEEVKDLRFVQGKTVKEISKIMEKSVSWTVALIKRHGLHYENPYKREQKTARNRNNNRLDKETFRFLCLTYQEQLKDFG